MLTWKVGGGCTGGYASPRTNVFTVEINLMKLGVVGMISYTRP